MRKWHRWLSVFFAVFLLFIATTGLLSQLAVLWPQPESASQAAAAEPPAGWSCPEGWRCRPAPPSEGIRSLTGFFHHLHSGEEFGPIGTAISVLSGLALVFFCISGIWMYVRMWARQRKGARRIFWK